jgi:hypothetical protein
MKKTLKDYYIEILTTAGERGLPSQVSNQGDDSAMYPYCKELWLGGYLLAKPIVGGTDDGHFLEILMNPVISPDGREYLERLKAERPLAKFKAKRGELLWLALTNAVTLIVTAMVTWILAKKP